MSNELTDFFVPTITQDESSNLKERVFNIQVPQLQDPGILENIRYDVYLARVLDGYSRNQIQEQLVSLRVMGTEQKLSSQVRPGVMLKLVLMQTSPTQLIPSQMSFDILFENEDVLVINKPRGLVVHPGAGNRDHTLVHGVLHYLQEKGETTMSDTDRPGIVHRLDKDTTGVIIVAKNLQAHEFLSKQFAQRKTKKTYLALSSVQEAKISQLANFYEPKLIETLIGRSDKNRQKYQVLSSDSQRGKVAITRIQCVGLNSQKDTVLFRLGLVTGRTHQIRVHLQHLGFPIIGDEMYGEKRLLNHPLFLHAAKLTLQLPGDDNLTTFKASPPADFLHYVESQGIESIDQESFN